MKKGILITLLSALAGGLTAFAVVKGMTGDVQSFPVNNDTPQFRTVNLSHDNFSFSQVQIFMKYKVYQAMY